MDPPLTTVQAICLYVIVGPSEIWTGLRNGSVQQKIRNKLKQIARPITEYREQQTPRSFSASHRRSLTISESDSGAGRTDSQAQAWLFRCPREIRDIVYLEVLRVPNLHIWRSEGRVHVSRCRVGDSTAIDIYDGFDAGFDHFLPERTPCADSDMQYAVLGLLCSCRRIYTEAVQLLFEQNTFHASHRTLNVLPQAMAPGRLASIRTLRAYVPLSDSELATWKRASAVLKRMSGLRSLHVSFGPSWVRSLGLDAMPLVEPLLNLCVADFAVQLLDGMLVDGLKVEEWLWRSDLPFRVVLRKRWNYNY
ncbi:uncharacterized protein DSM5745_09367 [Aspergillus mulundensis]|uniref:DUF7730 domain-containing protein n=1 Tax=Aspergillus mulundensis TaxID=1810919 RepID=A0A3D8R0R7_9EURO|nr:hypothetical protein DSM5745_09367 [Aspergillus mulundensis]RDW67501.1 hypothetical protein DSM5745_09367 [Aspergillus mulundensis]